MIATRPANVLPDNGPLGFLNPWLYSDEVLSVKGLNDIVKGSNPGCGTRGFTAIDGWDPVRPATQFSRKFRRWLILCSIGDGSRDAKLCKAAVPPQRETISRPYSDSGANAVMTTCCRLESSYLSAIQFREAYHMLFHCDPLRHVTFQ